jgi:hypothetical protein
MKKILSFACLLLIVCSCKKFAEKSNIVSNNQNNDLVSFTALGERFGVLPNRSFDYPPGSYPEDLYVLTTANTIQYLKNTLKVRYLRFNINYYVWQANKSNLLTKYKSYKDSGIKVQVNANWVDTTTDLFPTGTNYKNWLSAVLDSLKNRGGKPDLVVIQNEETADTYAAQTSTNINNYMANLTQGAIACSQKSVLCTNGGFTYRDLTYLTWDWLATTIDTATAKKFGDSVFPKHVHQDLINNGLDASLKIWKQKISSYNTSGISYINMHWYEPAYLQGWVEPSGPKPLPQRDGPLPAEHVSGGMQQIINYLHAIAPNLQIVSNEVGQLTLNSCTINDFIYSLSNTTMPVIIWYDGDGDPATPHAKALRYTNSDSSLYGLTVNGTEFKKWMNNQGTPCNP